MKQRILPDIFIPNTLIRSVLALSVALMGLSFVQANELVPPPNGQLFYLNSNMGIPLPGAILDPSEEDGIRMSEETYFEDGTTFRFTNLFGVGNYGDSVQPLIFVNPVRPNGDVDTSLTVGFPAQFLRFQDSDVVVYNNPYFQQEFAVEYEGWQSGATSYSAEIPKLSEYLTYVSRIQEAEAPTVYQARLTALPAAAGAADASTAVDGAGVDPSQRALQPTISTYGQLPGQNFRNDPRFADVVQVRAGQQIDRAIVEVAKENGEIGYARRERAIPMDQKLIPVPGVVPKTVRCPESQPNCSQPLLRAFHSIDNEGNIQLNSNGQPEVIFLPSEQLVYTPEGTSRIARVTDETALINPRAPSVSTLEPAVAEGEQLAFSECRNQQFAQQVSASGEDCRLVKIEDFQLVKSQLIQQLRGNVEDRSVLLNSGVIAVDNTTKMCSQIDISHEQYVDDSRAQTQISEYKQNMDTAYRALLRRIHSPAGGNIGVAYNTAPQASRHTFSCDRNQQSCRLSYDFDQTARLPLLREVTNFADDATQQEQIKIYGPSDDNQYLFVMKRGGQIVRSLVLQDDPGLIRNGRVGQLLADMDAFESSHRFTRLSEIQEQYNSAFLRDSREGHFINSETILPNGQPLRQSARLGTQEALALISQIRSNKTFYELQCRVNALQRSQPIPGWSSKSEGVQ